MAKCIIIDSISNQTLPTPPSRSAMIPPQILPNLSNNRASYSGDEDLVSMTKAKDLVSSIYFCLDQNFCFKSERKFDRTRFEDDEMTVLNIFLVLT